MTWLRTHLIVALLVLAALALPGATAECNTDDGVLTIDLNDLGIYLDGCGGGGGCHDDDDHDDHDDGCHGGCHDEGFFDFWWDD